MSTFPTTARTRPLGLSGGEAGSEGAGGVERLPPHDLAAEKGLLGSMIIDPQCIGPVCMLIAKPQTFYREEHQVVFRTILELYETNAPIDGMIVFSTLKTKGLVDSIGGMPYFEELVNSVPSSAHAEYYAGIVREKAMLRGLIVACTDTLRDAYDSGEPAATVLDRGEKRIFDIAQQKLSQQAANLTDVLHETFEMLDRQTGEHYSGVPTGFIELDNLTSGLQRGEMIVVAARPSVGKTAWAMNVVEHVGIDLKKPVAVFSLEMSKQQLAQRMLCSRSGVDSHKLRRGMLSRQDKDKLSYAVGDLSQGSIFIDDTPGLSIMDLRTKCRRLKLQYGIELVVIDYLQLMESPGARQENRQQEISTISRGVKALARELNVPVICLSQLNRASESEQRLPRTSDLRESGAIEQDADVVMLLHREAVMHRGDQEWMDANPDKINEALLIVAKQRNGPCDTVKMTFMSANTRFVNYNPGV
jgi:replicative DNA helicase